MKVEITVKVDGRLTDSTLDLLMQTAGGVAEQDRQAELKRLEAAPVDLHREELVPRERVAPQRLYVSCDGVTYRTRYRESDPERPGEQCLIYQEMKGGHGVLSGWEGALAQASAGWAGRSGTVWAELVEPGREVRPVGRARGDLHQRWRDVVQHGGGDVLQGCDPDSGLVPPERTHLGDGPAVIPTR